MVAKFSHSEEELHIAYYAHYHGAGHMHRAAAVFANLSVKKTLLSIPAAISSSSELFSNTHFVSLADDTEDFTGSPEHDAQGVTALHFVPLYSAQCRTRAAMFADWALRESPSLLVVDVSQKFPCFRGCARSRKL